jgi:hypothetical protein
MRKVLILLILFLPLVVAAKNKNKNKVKHMAPGRWVEVKRMTPDSSIVAFTDTMFMTFRLRDTFTYNVRNGFIYKGKYTLDDDDKLDFGTAHYTVAQRRPTKLTLADEKGIYIFAVDTSDTVATIVIAKEEAIVPVTTIDTMIGHWTVYKRTIEKEGASVSFADEIKSVYVTGPGSEDKQGYIYCGPDANNNPSWYIKGLETDQTLDCAGKNPRNIRVVKCQKGEMILEEGGIRYYFKQFK